MNDFSFLLRDLLGLLLSTILGGILLILPGGALAAIFRRFAPGPFQTDWRDWSPVLGIVLLPVFDALTIGLAGIWLAIAIHAVLALATLFFARHTLSKPTVAAAAVAALWWLCFAILYVDIDVGGRLYQALPVIDLVKHAAVVREIALHGLPLRDPFFFRAGSAGYYHYFYDGAAMLDRIGGRWIDARMAFVGAAFWCAAIFPLFLRNLIRELGWQRVSDSRLYLLCAAACFIGGLDLVGVLFRYLCTGIVEPNAEWWDSEISFVATSATWVPHHLTAVIAIFLGGMLIARSVASDDGGERMALIGGAGIAFASAFGLSLWVALAGGIVLGFSSLPIAGRRPPGWFGALAGAGMIAAILSLPQLFSVLQGRSGSPFPLAIWIREPARISQMIGYPLPNAIALLLTPLAWSIEFGVFALGSWLFYRSSAFSRESPLARLLAIGFLVGLAMNLFLISTVLNNDFGWRAAWFAEMPAMLWTIAIFQKPAPNRMSSAALSVTILLGLSCTVYNLAAARLVRPPLATTSFAYLNADPRADYALRQAYDWANERLGAEPVLQHNPDGAPRIFDFGLYGLQRTAFADSQAILFGASPQQVADRRRHLLAVFSGAVPVSDARIDGVDYLVITRGDVLWRHSTSACIFRNQMVCIVPTKPIGETLK